MEDVDLNGYPPVEQYRETISEFADQVCGCGSLHMVTNSECLHREGLHLESDFVMIEKGNNY